MPTAARGAAPRRLGAEPPARRWGAKAIAMTRAMLKMSKLDLATVQRAFDEA